MIEKISKPVKFDSEYDFYVVAKDGEKFFVANGEAIREDQQGSLVELGTRSLLQWALEVNYPLRKFVRLQKILVEKYFGA